MKIRTLKPILVSRPENMIPKWLPCGEYLPAGSVFDCPDDDDDLAQTMLAAGEVERIEEPKGAAR